MRDTDAPQVEPLTLTLGQRVRYAASLRRVTEHESYQAPSGRMVTRRKKVWKRGDVYFGELDPGEGVVVGLRTLSDGYADWEDEVGYTFESTHRHRAVLIATHIRHKHVLALLEDVEPLPVTERRDDTAELIEALEGAVVHGERLLDSLSHPVFPGRPAFDGRVFKEHRDEAKEALRVARAALARVKGGER